MKVLMDAYWWNHGPPSGRNVLRSIVNSWIEEFPSDELTLFGRWEAGAPTDLDRGSVRTLRTRIANHAVAVAGLRADDDYDLWIGQNFTPLKRPATVVATFVHDAIYKSNPEWFTRPERVYLSAIDPLLSRGDVVITTSVSEAVRIRSSLRNAHRVESVGLGVSRDLVTVQAKAPRDQPVGPFVLAVGRINVRKNLSRVIEAANGGLWPRGHQLVIVGEPDGAASLSSDLPSNVRFMGRMSDAELAWLYSKCEAFVFASLDEGYGMPPHEAGFFGSPVACSDLPVFRELLGVFSPAYFDPKDPRSIAAAVRESVIAGRQGTGRVVHSWADVVRAIRETGNVR